MDIQVVPEDVTPFVRVNRAIRSQRTDIVESLSTSHGAPQRDRIHPAGGELPRRHPHRATTDHQGLGVVWSIGIGEVPGLHPTRPRPQRLRLPHSMERDERPRVTVVADVSDPEGGSPTGISRTRQPLEVTGLHPPQTQFRHGVASLKIKSVKTGGIGGVIVNPHDVLVHQRCGHTADLRQTSIIESAHLGPRQFLLRGRRSGDNQRRHDRHRQDRDYS